MRILKCTISRLTINSAQTMPSILKLPILKPYPGSFPYYSSGFVRAGSEFFKAQGFGCGWERRVWEQGPSAETLAPERLKVLVEVFSGICVSSKPCSLRSLLGQGRGDSWHFPLLKSQKNLRNVKMSWFFNLDNCDSPPQGFQAWSGCHERVIASFTHAVKNRKSIKSALT